MTKRVAFVTIGQSPRSDLVPELLTQTRTSVAATEYGVLDEMTDAEIAEIAPGPDDARLVSRLRDGREVLLAKPAIEARLHTLLAALDRENFDLIVLLCTGQFDGFRLRTPFIEPQHAVDHFVQGLTYGVDRLGVLLPNAKQADEFHGIPGLRTSFASASPYVPDDDGAGLRAAGAALADSGMIVMHCMGYSEAMRRQVMRTAQCPVLLSRRLVALAIDLRLQGDLVAA